MDGWMFGFQIFDQIRRSCRELISYSRRVKTPTRLNETVKACPNCRRKGRLSPNSATVAVVSPFSATVALFCDSVDRALVASCRVGRWREPGSLMFV